MRPRTVLCGLLLFTCSLSLASEAEAPRGGRLLFLEVNGEQIPVALPGSTPRYLIDPRNGDLSVSFTPEEATLVAQALEERGLQDRILDALLGLRYLPEGRPIPTVPEMSGPTGTFRAPASLTHRERCLVLDIQGKEYRFNLPGGGPLYALDPITGEQVMRFSIADAKAISETLREDRGAAGSLMKVLFGLRRIEPAGHGGPHLGDGEPLDPPCNTCLDGALCEYEGQTRCCTEGGAGCTACKVCG